MATGSDIDNWLQRNKLGHLAQTFKEMNISSFDQLRDITEDHLSEMGIIVGDRITFKQAVEQAYASDTKETEINRCVDKMYETFKELSKSGLSGEQVEKETKALMKDEVTLLVRKTDAIKAPANAELSGDLEELLSTAQAVYDRVFQISDQTDGNLAPLDLAVSTEERNHLKDKIVDAFRCARQQTHGMFKPLITEATNLLQGIVNTARSLSGMLMNCLTDCWDFVKNILQIGLLWVKENWEIIAAVICVALLASLLIYCGPSVWGHAAGMIARVTKWIIWALKKVITKVPLPERCQIELSLTHAMKIIVLLRKSEPVSLYVKIPDQMSIQKYVCKSGAEIVWDHDVLKSIGGGLHGNMPGNLAMSVLDLMHDLDIHLRVSF